MTTFNTGNPIGSVSVKDLYDNAENLDVAVNSDAPVWNDRLGVPRKSWAGMEQDFSDFLAMSGFESVHLIYTPGTPLTVDRPTQLIDYDGSVYRVKMPSTFPVTLTGTWATDSVKLVDVGDASLRQSLALPGGADMIGTTEGTVQEALDAQTTAIAHRQKLLTTLPEIIEAATYGRNMVIQDGVYELSESIVIDYAVERPDDVGTGFPGFLSKRYDIQGQSQGNTIFIPPAAGGFAFELKGSYPITQDSAGFDQIGNMTITNAVRTSPNVDNSGGSGVFLQSKAFTKVSRIFAQNLATGFSFDGVLTSRFEQLIASGCYTGIKSRNTNGFSGPNAVTWANCRASNTYSNGWDIDVGSATHFDCPVAEGCGTMGTPSCGMLLTAQADQIGGNIVMNAPYLELNAGEADLYINNKSSFPLIVTINGGTFARAGNAYTKHNIHAHSDGGGQVIVLLKGVTFLSVAGYPASIDRPFWLADANCMVIPDEYCRFNETTSLPIKGNRFSQVRGLVLDTAGNIIAGDSTGLTVTRPSTGVYQVSTTGLFGVNELSYNVTAIGCDSTATGFGTIAYCRFQPVGGGQFIIQTYNQAGAPTNGPIALQITSMRGGV